MPRRDKQAGYMTAPDHNAANVTFSLQRRGRPYRTQYLSRRSGLIGLRLRSGLLPGELAGEALLESGDETRRSQGPPGALAGSDRFMIVGIQPFGQEAPPVGRQREQRAYPDQHVIVSR